MDASGPTTIHPVMPVEPFVKFVKPPTGTCGVSKLPFEMRFARAGKARRLRMTTPKKTFQDKMLRIALRESCQRVADHSKLAASCLLIHSPFVLMLHTTVLERSHFLSLRELASRPRLIRQSAPSR